MLDPTAGKSNGFQMGVNGSSLTVHAHCKQLASVIAGARLFLGKMGMTCDRSEGTRARTPSLATLPCSFLVGAFAVAAKEGALQLPPSLPIALLSCPLSLRAPAAAQDLLFLFHRPLCVFESLPPHSSIICYQKKTHTALPLQIRHYCRQRFFFSALKRIAPLPHPISTG